MLLHTPSAVLPSPPESHRALGSNFQPEPRSVLLGDSLPVRRLRTQVQRIAPYLRTALILGESGTGKEQIARALHEAGPQRHGAFVPCSAVAFAEALFGQRSSEDASSLLDSARGGTLYLRRVDELAYPLQGSLQRFLAERESMRLTNASVARIAGREVDAEVKIIASSSRDLRALSSVAQFRAELYAKLSVLEVRVPALNERAEDLPAIAEALLEAASRAAVERKVLSSAAMDCLKAGEWRGNLRELEQALVHGAALAQGPVIEDVHLPRTAVPAHNAIAGEAAVEPGGASDDRLDTIVQRHVLEVLTRCRGNKLRAAEMLGISRSTLYRMLEAGSFAGQVERRGV